MTTYQDPPPLSRRALRETERAQTEARETAERATEEHVLRPATGRRSLGPEQNAPAEPLAYVTQSRPNLPTYAGRGRPLNADAGDAMPPTQALAKQDHPSYRSRDYSPEARRSSAFSAPQPRSGGELDYFTQGGPGQLTMERPQVKVSQPTAESAPTPAPLPVAPGAAASDPVPNATLTRRELRALRAAAQSQISGAKPPVEPPTTEAVDFLLRSGPIDLPRPARATSSAPVSALDALSLPGVALTADALAAATSSEGDSLGSPAPLGEPQQQQTQKYPSFTDLIGIQRNARAEKDRSAGEARMPEPEAAEPEGIQSFFDDTDTPTAVAPVIPQTPASDIRGEKPAEAPAREGDSARAGSAFPVWSQSDLEEDTFPPGMSRGFASGSTGSTPASLVIPAVPNPSELSYALSTGEILVTGSIDLPRSLGATGAHPDTLDDAIDLLLDADDEEMKTTGSTPVRAIRAVSSHTSTRGMIAARKPASNRLPTVLAISASAMGAVVLTLGIVSVATGSL